MCYITSNDGDWICRCKNVASDSGFDTYNFKKLGSVDGRVEPLEGVWDGIHYVCNQCEAIINQDTLEIVGQVSEKTSKRDEFKSAVEAFVEAGRKLEEAWDEDSVENYPSYLPSFDEFISEFSEVAESETTHQKTVETVKLAQDEINIIWASLEVAQDHYLNDEEISEDERNVFKALYEKFARLENVCGP